jgi:hypothetical protein
VLEAVFILLEFPSPSRRIFIGSHSLPPLVRRIAPSGTGSAALGESLARIGFDFWQLKLQITMGG